MQEKIKEMQTIIDWYCKNSDILEPLDSLVAIEATFKFAERLKPLYEKYNKVESKGFKILARIEK